MTTLNINRRNHDVVADPDTPLLWVLRDHIGLTGTKYGCGIARCGACTVRVNGDAIKSCLMLAVQAEGCEVTTVEGMATGGKPHPLQETFNERHALQCGFCTPGILMNAAEFLEKNPNPSEEEIRHSLIGNLCRCTGYVHIVEAISDASERMR